MIRSPGLRIADHPQWHHVRVSLPDGAVMTGCGRVGSRVIEEVPSGAMIVPCPVCLTPRW